MAYITVKPLRTTNTTPILTGTVDFTRIDSSGVARENIEVEINYNVYKLFDGRLGIDEKVIPNVWKLHFDSPLFEGTYDVEARVVDANTGSMIAKDSTNGELIIEPIPVEILEQQSNMTILQKVALVSSLMNSVNKMFGGQNGVGGNPSVHPSLDDDSSTSLSGRSDQERGEDPRVKDKEKRQKATTAYLPPKNHPMKSTDSGAAAADIETPDSGQAKDALSKLDAEDRKAVMNGELTKAEKAQYGVNSAAELRAKAAGR
jgi:hypothetical protein